MATSINFNSIDPTNSNGNGYAAEADDRLFINGMESAVFNVMSLAAHFGLVEERRYEHDESTVTTWAWTTDHGKVYSLVHQTFHLAHPDYDPEDVDSAYLSTDEFADISAAQAVKILRDLPTDVRRQVSLFPWQRAAHDALVERIAI